MFGFPPSLGIQLWFVGVLGLWWSCAGVEFGDDVEALGGRVCRPEQAEHWDRAERLFPRTGRPGNERVCICIWRWLWCLTRS